MAAPLSVLVVEDDFLIRACLTEFLEDSDIHVLEAESCAEAWRHLDQSGPIHAVVTDISLPDGNGKNLSMDLRARWPEMPVIFTSGHGASVYEKTEIAPPHERIVPKPYPLSAVLDAIHELTGTHQDRVPAQ